ncbi:isotrichodermin C-15 hydroxylase [Astrocystis sublimbata]|nr:isotrichodermin C-15 hydroxylase [Astrocystis sublimbata]
MEETSFIAQMAPDGWSKFSLVFMTSFTLLCAYIVPRCIYLLYFHPAARFPGPRLAAISNFPFAYYWLRGRWPWAVEEMVKEYGDVVRVAPNEIVFATTQAALDIYNPAVKHHETWLKTDNMDFGAKDGGFIWEQDPVKRREPTMQKYIDLFITKMKAISPEPEGVDLNKWLVWLAMDMSADLAYSRQLHQMQEETSSDFMETLLGTNLFGTIMQVSKKIPLLTPLAYLVIPLKVMRKVGKTFQMNSDEVQRRIDNHGNTEHPDFMEYMLSEGTPFPIPKRLKIHIEQVALQIFIAGFDPVQLVFFSSLFFLLKEPEVLDILVQEIRASFQSYDDITPDALSSLPYLNACIHETLRVHTAISTGMPRMSPGATVDGHYIPKGVVCQTSFFSIARNPRNFHEPLSFHPARWLPVDHPRYEARFSEDKLKGYLCQIRFFLAKDATFDKDYSTHMMWYKPDVRVKFIQR